MTKTKKAVVFLIGAVVVVSVFVYYRYAQSLFLSTKQEGAVAESGIAGTSGMMPDRREVGAIVTYDAYEGKMDTLHFVVSLDKDGIIQEIKTLDAVTNEIPEKKKEFNDQVNVLLKGKKLSELTTIDKIGGSSRTSEAFNKVLPELQAAR